MIEELNNALKKHGDPLATIVNEDTLIVMVKSNKPFKGFFISPVLKTITEIVKDEYPVVSDAYCSKGSVSITLKKTIIE